MENPYSAPQTSLVADSVAVGPRDVRRMFPEIETPRLRKIVRQSVSIQAIGQLLGLGGMMVLLIVGAVFWPSAFEGLGRDRISLLATGCALFAIVASYGIGVRSDWGRWAGIIACAAMLLGIVVLFTRVFWFSNPETLGQNLVITAVLALPAVIPALGLEAFLRRSDLFGPQRLRHRDLAQELTYRVFHAYRPVGYDADEMDH